MIASGQSFGNYRILAKIGTGGMGAVYLAEHPLIGKKVALKVIHRELAGNREVVQRFFQEARAVNQIGNEHVVEIHDFGVTPENDHFYIMEYLEGRTLASILTKDGPLSVMRALHVGAQIASAMGAAHNAGVIHRDLKPDNVMVMKRHGDADFVKVLDFGLAKIVAGGPSAVKTAAGVLLGTPQYMSPEACEGRGGIDHRTDIYALGVLLFQMMTGKLPFDGESMGELLVKQVMHLPPAPRGINPAIPPAVEQILLRCLAKPIEARFASMAALREALLDPEAYLRGSPPITPARSVPPGQGVDAKTMLAHAAELQSAAADRRTKIGELGAQQPPWQVAPTIMADGALGRPMPTLVPPQVPNPVTMQIATPPGHSSRRRRWPVVLVLGTLLGLAGGAIAVTMARDSDEPVASPPVVAVDAGVPDASAPAVAVVAIEPPAAGAARSGQAGPIDAAVVVDAGAPPVDAAPVATLTFDSTPPGATVYGPGGELLGKTRLQIEWPIAPGEMEFELRLPGYHKKRKTVVVTGNTTIGVELERATSAPRPAPAPVEPAPPLPPPAPEPTPNGLIRPGE